MSNPNASIWRPIAQNVETDALESNVNAVLSVADTVRTTLGPKGLDKLLIDQAMNRHVSNDGVTILLSLNTIHPIARMIVEIAERQERLVGDGTTTAVVMAAEMIKDGRRLIRELGVHPTKVAEGIETGVMYACEELEKESIKIKMGDPALEQVVKTSLASKLDGAKLTSLVMSALLAVGERAVHDGSYDFDRSIKVIRKTDIPDTLVNGVVLERRRMDTSMPLEKRDPKIIISKLDLKPVKDAWLKENSKYDEILAMEKDRMSRSKEIVDAIVATGANTVLVASPEVDQNIENMLVARKILAVQIGTDEVEYLSRYTGAKPVRMQEDLKLPDVLGTTTRIFEDEEKGLVYLEGGLDRSIVTLMVSGTTKETSLERWRAVVDGVNAAEAALNKNVVPGGGAAELHAVRKLNELRLQGLEQVGLDVVVAALESVMRQILTNAGFNGLEKVMAAKASPKGYGIDISTGNPIDMMKLGVLDPLLVKTTALQAAGEMAKSVLRIDRNLAAGSLTEEGLAETKR